MSWKNKPIAKNILLIVLAFFLGWISSSYWDEIKSIGFHYEISTRNDQEYFNLKYIAGYMEYFREDCGSYPITNNILESLAVNTDNQKCWKGPYLENKYYIPKFPVRNGPFHYISDGKEYLLYHYGNDGVRGGNGQNQDIYLSSFDYQNYLSKENSK